MMNPRTAIFNAVRSAAPAGLFNDPGNVLALDNLLDAFSVPREQNGRRQINAAGLQIVKDSEGLELKAYICPAGVLTVGYGSTGSHVKPGMVITEAQADELLRSDLRRFEDAVADMCKVATDNQFSALVSFTFNLGEGSLRDSTLRRKHNSGDYTGAAGEFAKWNKARVGGVLKELPGLTKRRAKEAALYRKAG